MESLKNKKVLVYVVMGLLSLAAIYSQIVICTYGNTFSLVAETIFTCIMFALIAYYAITNFKVPHGNLLKYLFLTFSVMCFVGLLNIDTTSGLFSQSANYAFQIARGIVVIISTYIAGRLDRIKQNTVLMVINAILLLATSIECIVLYKTPNLILNICLSNFFIMWLDLMIAYLFRYSVHKEAGLENK